MLSVICLECRYAVSFTFSVVMLNVIYLECRYAECHYTECHGGTNLKVRGLELI